MKTGMLTSLVREVVALDGANIGKVEEDTLNCSVGFYLGGMQFEAVRTDKQLVLRIVGASAIVPNGRSLTHGLAILADMIDKAASANECGQVCGVCEEIEDVVWSGDAEMHLCPTCLAEGERGDNDG